MTIQLHRSQLIERAVCLWRRLNGNAPGGVKIFAASEFARVQDKIYSAGLEAELAAALQEYEENDTTAKEN